MPASGTYCCRGVHEAQAGFCFRRDCAFDKKTDLVFKSGTFALLATNTVTFRRQSSKHLDILKSWRELLSASWCAWSCWSAGRRWPAISIWATGRQGNIHVHLCFCWYFFNFFYPFFIFFIKVCFVVGLLWAWAGAEWSWKAGQKQMNSDCSKGWRKTPSWCWCQ